MLIGVPPSGHFKLAWVLLCFTTKCAGRVWAVTVPPVVFQCRLQKLEFIQWHPSVGLFQLSFSSGVPVYHESNGCVASGIPMYTGSTSGIPVAFQCTLDQPVYTGSG